MTISTATPLARPVSLPPEAEATVAPRASAAWELSGRTTPDGALTRVPLAEFPFKVGRHPRNHCTVAFPTVSGHHAEIAAADGRLILTDIGSTNGTFLNGRRLDAPDVLKSGDVIQFGTAVFTLLHRGASAVPSVSPSTIAADAAGDALAHVQFDKLMSDPAVTAWYQPIIRLSDRASIAYEVLARSRLIGLENPSAMFRVAGERGVEARLSQLLRAVGLRKWFASNPPVELYLNTHPTEVNDPGLIPSLEKLRKEFSTWPIVLEIHEAAVTDTGKLAGLKQRLSDLGIRLAYDDFGAGQSRLAELINVPPDVLKFDITLVRGLAEAPTERKKLIASLIETAKNLGVKSLAEGIETAGDAAACIELGFDLAQGFHFGVPAPAEVWSSRSAT